MITFDTVIINGTIVDGTLGKPFSSGIAIKDGRIAKLFSSKETVLAREVIDARGQVVVPGFIDIHSHSDSSPLKFKRYDSKVQQGITTEVIGNCGSSPTPAWKCNDNGEKKLYTVSDYSAELNRIGLHNNYCVLIGHGRLRKHVMGHENRVPTIAEMSEMKRILDDELSSGAFGLSLGLNYTPSGFATTDELVELAKVVTAHDAVVSVHMRSEGKEVFKAIDEMITVARESGARVEISHLKLLGKGQWGQADALLAKIKAARAEGLRINCDQYPFTASNTDLNVLIPKHAHDGGTAKMLERIANADTVLKSEICALIAERGGAEAVLIRTAQDYPEFEGKLLSEIAASLSLDPVEAAIHIALATRGNTNCTYFCIGEDDMLKIMSEMFIAVGSDGTAIPLDGSAPASSLNIHPRYYATFPNFFKIVRDRKMLSLEQAVFKATALPAQILGLPDRGQLKEGNIADIVIFNPDKIGCEFDYTNTIRKPAGISRVIVSGKTVVKDTELVTANIGRVLRS